MLCSYFRPSQTKRKPNKNKLKRCTNPVINFLLINIFKNLSQSSVLPSPSVQILLSYSQGIYKTPRNKLEDAIFCESRRHISRNPFFSYSRNWFIASFLRTWKKYWLFSKEASGCSTVKKKKKKAKQKYIHRTLKRERKCVIRERLRRPHPEDLWVKRNLPSSQKDYKKTCTHILLTSTRHFWLRCNLWKGDN